MLDTILNSEAVSFEDERLDVADLVLVGLITGAWAQFELDVCRGLALERDAVGAFSSGELKASATEFRYAHRLLSASEFTAWLAARSLTVADLSGVLGRAIRRGQMGDGACEVELSELAGVLRAEALCCGVFEQLADSAIERLAAAHRLGCLGSEVSDERVDAAVASASERRAAGLDKLGQDQLARRLRRLWAYEDARASLREQVAEPVALRRRLTDHGLDWLRLDGFRLRFAAEDAAREARALIRDDGLGVEEVSTLSGIAATADSLYLDQVPAQLAGALAATVRGEVAAPWFQDEQWNVLVVTAKTAPSLEDPVLRERAIDELLADVLHRQAAGRARLPVLSEAADRSLLAGLPLLAELPESVRELVERSFTTVELGFGEAVFRQGQAPDAYYVVAAGSARVVVEGEDGEEVSLNVVRAGDAFGEGALLEGTPRTATVRASSPMRLLRLDRGVFQALIDVYPDLGAAFRDNQRARQINDFLRLHSAFAVVPRELTLELIDQFDELRLADGEDAVHQGDPGDALYLVQDGRLGVWIDGHGETSRVRTLHSGEFFGELALVQGSPRTATVRAEGPVRLLRLSAANFHRLMAGSPGFAARVAERMALYATRDRHAAPAAGNHALPAADENVWSAADPGLAVSETGAEEEAGAARRQRRFPFVRQIDEMDCGAACIAMLCRYYGHNVSMASIRSAVGTDVSGTALTGLIRGGEEVGLRMRAIKSSADRIDALPLPAIVHWEGNHWVIAHRVDRERLRVVDPARGPRKVTRAELAEKWSGYTALATPTEALASAPRGGLDLRWLGPFVRPYRRVIVIAVLLSLVAAGFEMALPVFSQVIVDHVIRHHDQGLLFVLMAAMLGALLVAVGVTVLQRFLLARVASHLDSETLDFISAKLLRLPMRYFETRRTGDIQRRISGVHQVRAVLVQNGLVALTAATQLVVALVIMFGYSWTLGLLFLLGAPLYGGLMRFSERRLRPVMDSVEEGQARYESRQIDAIRGIETVKVMGAEESLRRRMADEFGLLREKLFRSDLVVMTYEGLVSLVTFFIYGLFLFVGALEVLHHDLTVGGLIAISGLVLLANTPIALLLALWDRLQLVSVLLGRLQDVFEQEPEQGHDHSRLRRPTALEGHVRLRRVGFAYASAPDRPILQDISLVVEPGTTVGLVGRSGSGKSTLVKCLAGLLVPTAGAIEYDGIDLRELHFPDLRRRIGFVLQTPYLFDDTIEANIAFGEEHPDGDQLRWAAEVADAAEFIENLPLGYKTRVGDSGLRLSGGQAQRISIARALYLKPPVLIFDEATSALDTEAERAVKQNTDRLLEGRTAFVIAHRLTTIRDADIICVLEQGRLVEHGSHEELMRRQGLYAYLQAQQFDG